jgi:hypothetical protein
MSRHLFLSFPSSSHLDGTCSAAGEKTESVHPRTAHIKGRTNTRQQPTAAPFLRRSFRDSLPFAPEIPSAHFQEDDSLSGTNSERPGAVKGPSLLRGEA